MPSTGGLQERRPVLRL